MMPKFHVKVPRLFISTMEIEAEDEDDARFAVEKGDGEEISLEFSHSITEDGWEVEKA